MKLIVTMEANYMSSESQLGHLSRLPGQRLSDVTEVWSAQKQIQARGGEYQTQMKVHGDSVLDWIIPLLAGAVLVIFILGVAILLLND